MRFEMKMPDLATTDSQIRVVRWLIGPGQKVERGQQLLEVETDKATMEVESVVTGVLQEVKADIDDEVSAGQVIAILEIEDIAQKTCSNQSAAATSSDSDSPSPAVKPRAYSNPKGMFARNRSAATAATAVASSPNRQEGIPLSVAHRTAAKRLQESKQIVPHFYLQTSFNAASVISARNAARPVQPAWDAFFVRAVAQAIGKFDRFRYRFDGERLIAIESEGIGVAIDHEGELYVIPITSPATKTIGQISAEIRGNVEKLRNGDPQMRKIRPGLMTVTNLGMCNIESFIPIINPPEAAILGVGKVSPKPVVQPDGRIGIEHRATLTLSVDHRIVSGKYAGEFLEAIINELENIHDAS